MDNPVDQSQNHFKMSQKLHYFTNGKYCVFLYYRQGHPVNCKDKFVLGRIKVFDDSKMFIRELDSKNHLSQQLDWTHDFFSQLIQCFANFQILEREDLQDKTLDFVVRGNCQQKQDEELLKAPLVEDFGCDVQREFWKEFENYNNTKNQQIKEYEEMSRLNNEIKRDKLNRLKEYYSSSQVEKKKLLGRLSALLAEKVNKLREFEEDYNIELFEDKLKKYKEGQQQKIMVTYQQDMELAGTLFQPSQDFR